MSVQFDNIIKKRKDLIREREYINNERLEKLYATDNEYKILKDTLDNLESQGIDAIIKGEELGQIESQLFLQKHKIAEYISNNTTINTSKYICEKCHDTGFANGKICECIIQEMNENIVSIQSKTPAYSFSNNIKKLLSGTSQEKTMLEIYTTFEKYAKLFPNISKKNILLMGGCGVGKSGAIVTLTNKLIETGHDAIYLNAFDLHNIFLKYHIAPFDQKEGILESLLNCEFLAIDDLGTEPIFKNVTLEYLYLLLEQRLNTNLATAVVTNLSIDSLLDRYGDRITSRISNKRITYIQYINNGNDLRWKK